MSLRWSEADVARYLHKGQPAPMTEAVWMAIIRRLAKDAGYSFQYHVWDSRRTVYGWPDLALVNREPGHPCYLIECKTDVGQVTPAQQAWLEALQGATGIVAGVWRPSMLDTIVAQLRR